nr:probable pectinesterase/pectinesterase inhibitor 41 [Nicotiana tomentosiformis]
MTFKNTAGPSLHQAVAVSIEADHVAFYRCKFDGYQDTLYTRKGVQFFKNCDVYGTVDFIFGNAKVILQDCNIYARKPEDYQHEVTITAQGRKHKNETTAIVLQGCTINVTQDLREHEPKVRVYLGRPWKNYSRTIVMSSYLDEFIDPEGWTLWNGKPSDIYFAEYNNRGPGADTSQRVNWERQYISDSEASNFTVRNFLHGDEWIPSAIPYTLDLV